MRKWMRCAPWLVLAAAGFTVACGDDAYSSDGIGPGALSASSDSDSEFVYVAGQGGAEGGAPASELLYSPFVATAHDPLSTFASDVDTGSYDVFRNLVGEYAELPEPALVRTEEFINSFPLSGERPGVESAVPFSVAISAGTKLIGRETSLLRITLNGKDAAKPKANLVFLVDVSGSMLEEMATIQTMLRGVVEELEPDDRISIVTYAGETGTALPSTRVAEKSKILAAIDDLSAGGSTNGAGGIVAAYDQATVGFLEDGVNHVVLCTDGDFNVGPSSTEELVSLIEEKRKTGINLTAVGFGYRSNDGMMERVADTGNGIYNYVGTVEDATRYAHEDFLPTMVHIAKDVKIQVEFNPRYVYAWRLLGYENRAIADDDFRDDQVDAGEIGARHQVTALYELVMKNDEMPSFSEAPPLVNGIAFDGAPEVGASELARVKVRYKAPSAKTADPAEELSEGFLPGELASAGGEADGELEWSAAVATYAEILRKSPYVEKGQLEAVLDALARNTRGLARREEFLQLVESSLRF